MSANTATHTTAPVTPTFEFAHTPPTLHSRADSTMASESVNLIAIITSLAGVIITVVGLILGYIYWKYPRKAASPNLRSSPVPGANPSPSPGSNLNINYMYMHALWLALLVQRLAPVHPTLPGHESDLESGRVSSLTDSEPDITVKRELANTV